MKGGRAKAASKKVEGAAKSAGKEAAKVEKAIKKEVKAVRTKQAKHVVPRPTGRAPVAMVTTRHGTDMVERPGKGFSHGEIAGAGIDGRLAARWGVSLDQRRRSVLDGNVSSLKQWNARPSAGAAAKRDLREVEEKVEEVAKEIEEDVEIIEQEVKRAGSAAKKDVKRAEGAVREKVEKPRARKKKTA